MNGKRPLDEISGEIVDAAYKLHSALGPGLLESAYELLLIRDLERRGLTVERQKLVSFEHDGLRVADGLRIDLLVDGRIIVEVKSVEIMLPVHTKQLLTYLRAMHLQVGLLLNFGAATMKEGIRRIVNGYKPPFSATRLDAGGKEDQHVEAPRQDSNPRLS